MPFTLIRNDITTMKVDAIVNAANTALAPGGGVCGAIFRAAGYEQMEEACRRIGHCDVGHSVITEGFRLPARYVIHTPGPVWQGGGHGEASLLRSSYRSALALAEHYGCGSIAFPLISSGIYGFPKEQALQIAMKAIEEFLEHSEMQVYLAVFDRKATALGQKLLGSLRSYLDDHYAELRTPRRRFDPFRERQLLEQEAIPAPCATPMAASEPKKRSLQELLGNLDESFSGMLLRLIDEKGMTDVEVYKRANLDRKLFSKLRKEGYNPSKPTAIALAVALRLNLDETMDLLGKAGYALSNSSKFDVIIRYFIEENIYDIYTINEALFTFDQRLLGA